MKSVRTGVAALFVASMLSTTIASGSASAQTATPAPSSGFDGYWLLAVGTGVVAGVVVATVLTDGVILPVYAWATAGEGGGMMAGGMGGARAGMGGAAAGEGAAMAAGAAEGAAAGEGAAMAAGAAEGAATGEGGTMMAGRGGMAGSMGSGGMGGGMGGGGGAAAGEGATMAAGAAEGAAAGEGGTMMAGRGGMGGGDMATQNSFMWSGTMLFRRGMQALGAISGGLIADDMYGG